MQYSVDGIETEVSMDVESQNLGLRIHSSTHTLVLNIVFASVVSENNNSTSQNLVDHGADQNPILQQPCWKSRGPRSSRWSKLKWK